MGKSTNSASGAVHNNSMSATEVDSIKDEPLHQSDSAQMNSTNLKERTTSVKSNTRTPSDNQTQPGTSDDKERIVFEPLDQSPYDLSYTCLLIPRFSSHYLMGDLALCLPEWMQQICISYGWRLKFINVTADYLQWTISVPPSTPTAHFMKAIRHHSSVLVFEDFPRIKRENMSNDFWAPGYLIYFGTQPHPIEVIRAFIYQTRQQQGILPDG